MFKMLISKKLKTERFINQILFQYLKQLRDKILEHIEMLEFVSINHIYRENNKRADELANLALDS